MMMRVVETGSWVAGYLGAWVANNQVLANNRVQEN